MNTSDSFPHPRQLIFARHVQYIALPHDPLGISHARRLVISAKLQFHAHAHPARFPHNRGFDKFLFFSCSIRIGIRPLDRRTSDLMTCSAAQCAGQRWLGDTNGSPSRKSRSFTPGKRNALRRTCEITFPPAASFGYVRSETRFGGRIGRGGAISPSRVGTRLELESWPVSRK